MELQVLDQDPGGAARGVNSLSGGETFLVSLGLALGLSGLAARAARVESLFVDEGFGTLDSESLDQAMAVLEGLRATGRTVSPMCPSCMIGSACSSRWRRSAPAGVACGRCGPTRGRGRREGRPRHVAK